MGNQGIKTWIHQSKAFIKRLKVNESAKAGGGEVLETNNDPHPDLPCVKHSDLYNFFFYYQLGKVALQTFKMGLNLEREIRR